MSGPEQAGAWRRLHLPYSYVVEQWGKQDDKVFVWSNELEWGGWASASDFKIVTTEEAKVLNRFGQPFGKGQSDKVDVPVSLSLSTIEAILREVNSPAITQEADFAQFIYNRSFVYNIDPAFLLAFFRKESYYGKAGAPIYNKNIGNIICTSGYKCAGGWRKYDTWKESAEDWFKLISTYYVGVGLDRVSSIIRVYAPASAGNDTYQYNWQVNSWIAEYRGREDYSKLPSDMAMSTAK